MTVKSPTARPFTTTPASGTPLEEHVSGPVSAAGLRQAAERLAPLVTLVLLPTLWVVLLAVRPEVPLEADARQYADTAQHLVAGHGFVTTAYGALSDYATPRPGLYPPGLPVLLAPFAAAGDVRLGAAVLSLLYYLAAVWAAWTLGGRCAAFVTAVCVAAAPFLLQSSMTVMSDAVCAALALAAMALLARPSRRRLVLVGLAVGFGVLVRLAGAPVALAAVLAAPRGQRRWVLLGGAPCATALLLFQWHYFGSPFASSYGDYGEAIAWSLSYVVEPSRGDYTLQINTGVNPFSAQPEQLPGWLYWPASLGVWWAFAPPLVGLLGLPLAWQSRRTPVGRYVLLTTGGMLLVTVPYFYQASRMLAAPASMLLVLASLWVCSRWSRRTGPLAWRRDCQLAAGDQDLPSSTRLDTP